MKAVPNQTIAVVSSDIQAHFGRCSIPLLAVLELNSFSQGEAPPGGVYLLP
jgi:hypothetical protein